MTSKHNEFPPLTGSGIEVLQHANTANYENRVGPGGVRPFAAAVIREAVKQAAPFNLVNIVDMSIQQVIPSHQPEKRKDLLVVAIQDLMDIADNLHALPPEPLLKKQALDIWGQVEGEVSDAQARIMRTALALIPDPTP